METMRLLSTVDKATQLAQGTTVHPGSLKCCDTAVVRPHTDYRLVDLSAITPIACRIIIRVLIILQRMNSWPIATIKPCNIWEKLFNLSVQIWIRKMRFFPMPQSSDGCEWFDKSSEQVSFIVHFHSPGWKKKDCPWVWRKQIFSGF